MLKQFKKERTMVLIIRIKNLTEEQRFLPVLKDEVSALIRG